MILGLARRIFDLPAPRCETWLEEQWIPMHDGVRLATTHVWPVSREEAPTVLMRTPYGMSRLPVRLVDVARLIASRGYHVILQDVRGRYASEGRFTPFVAEARDGRTTIEWIGEQPWHSGRLGLAGLSYGAYTSWAAVSELPEQVSAISVGIGASDLYASFYRGGAFALESLLEWASTVGDHQDLSLRDVDLPRGLAHRPTREADRVALRRVDAYRDWLDHPRRDGYWDALFARLPEAPPPSLFLAGLHDIFLHTQIRDYEAVRDAANHAGAEAPRLVLGPWNHGAIAHRGWRRRGNGFAGVMLRETLSFFDRHLRGESSAASNASDDASVRFYLPTSPAPRLRPATGSWRDAESWPPSSAHDLELFLHSGGRANGAYGDGKLERSAPADAQPPDVFRYDPDDPVPTSGGALLSRARSGVADQRHVEARHDVLCFTTEVLEADLHLAGTVRLLLHIASSAPCVDWCAKLCVVTPSGEVWNVCEGILRSRWRDRANEEKEPGWLDLGAIGRVEVELGNAAHCFRPGDRIRLEIASSNFPHYDRNSATQQAPSECRPEDAAIATQSVFHDADNPSRVVLCVLS